jgi:hypothetical protein
MVYVSAPKNAVLKGSRQQREPANYSKHNRCRATGYFPNFFPPFPMNTGSDSAEDNDQLPIGQRQRAEEAHLNPNEPATQAEAGTPAYGDFGKPGAEHAGTATASTSRNDGSNDNPDEFSDSNKPDQHVKAQPNGEPESNSTGPQRGHVTQNQDPSAVRDAQHADTDAQRAAWSDDDPRYAGGKQQATWEENNDKEHSNS